MVEGDVAMYCISTDTTLTSANLHSALASLSDGELRDVLDDEPADSREQMITNWMMKCPIPTWEGLAGQCFSEKKEKALEEVKKHFKRKLGINVYHDLIYRPCVSVFFPCILYVCMCTILCMNEKFITRPKIYS